MRYFTVLLLSFSALVLSCATEANDNDSNAKDVRSEIASQEEAPTADPVVPAGHFFPPAAARQLLGCDEAPTVNEDSRDNGGQCSYTCTSPFGLVSFAYTIMKPEANESMRDRRDKNTALTKVAVSGADFAHFMEAQGRITFHRAEYGFTLSAPGKSQADIISAAEAVISRL